MNINRSVVIPLFLAALLMVALATRSEARNETKKFDYLATGGFEPTLFIFPDGNQGVVSITLEGTSTFGPITVHEWAVGSSTQTVFPPCTAPGGAAGALYDFADSLEINFQENRRRSASEPGFGNRVRQQLGAAFSIRRDLDGNQRGRNG